MKRCLFVGLGGIGQRHLRNLRALVGDQIEVAAYRVRREQQVLSDTLSVLEGKSLEAEYGIEVFSDLDAALGTLPEAVFVTNPSSLHTSVATRAAEAGCHLFIEKPLSHTTAGLEALASSVERRGLVGFVAFQLRFHPAFKRLSSWLAEERIGPVFSVQAEVGEYLPAFHPYEDYRRMYASRQELGGGVTLSQIHEIDYLYALFGRPERVFSMGGQLSELEVDVDDLSSSLLEFRRPDGRPLVASLHQDYVQRPKSRGAKVLGERGRIEWSLSDARLRLFDSQAALVEDLSFAEVPRNQPYLEELQHFLDCVAGRAKPLVDLRDGLHSVAIAEAILESQRTGRCTGLAVRVAA